VALPMHGAARETVLAGRDAGQRAHNETESDLLLDKRDEQDEENERGSRNLIVCRLHARSSSSTVAMLRYRGILPPRRGKHRGKLARRAERARRLVRRMGEGASPSGRRREFRVTTAGTDLKVGIGACDPRRRIQQPPGLRVFYDVSTSPESKTFPIHRGFIAVCLNAPGRARQDG
jgi:hypothetical protein